MKTIQHWINGAETAPATGSRLSDVTNPPPAR